MSLKGPVSGTRHSTPRPWCFRSDNGGMARRPLDPYGRLDYGRQTEGGARARCCILLYQFVVVGVVARHSSQNWIFEQSAQHAYLSRYESRALHTSQLPKSDFRAKYPARVPIEVRIPGTPHVTAHKIGFSSKVPSTRTYRGTNPLPDCQCTPQPCWLPPQTETCTRPT